MWVIRISKDYNHHLELNVQLLWWAKHRRFCCKKGHIHSSYWLQPSGDKNGLWLWLKCKLQNWKTEKSNCKNRTLVRSHLAGRSTERRPRDDDWWCPTMVSNWKPQPALQDIQISTTLVTEGRCKVLKGIWMPLTEFRDTKAETQQPWKGEMLSWLGLKCCSIPVWPVCPLTTHGIGI